MSVTYSAGGGTGSGPIPAGSPTTATVLPNETNVSASVGSPMVFTFNVPDGMWTFLGVNVSFTSAHRNISAVLDMTGSQASGPLVVGGTDGIVFFNSGYLDPQQTIPSTPSIGDIVNLSTSLVNGYTVLKEIMPGGLATLTISLPSAYNASDAVMTGGNAVMTLISITPNTPYAALSLPASPVAGGPPYAGTATATIPATYLPSVLNPQDNRPAIPNGWGPLTYEWQYPAQPDAETPVPSAVQESWSYPTPPNVDSVPVVIKLTNALFPHQLSAPLSAVYSGTVYYIVPLPPNALITPVASYALAEDAHGRPALLSPNKASPANLSSLSTGSQATGINGLVSNTAGKTYLISSLSDTFSGYFADNFGADNPCLLVDRRTNHFRAIYSLSQSYIYGGASQSRTPDQIILASGLLTDRFSAEVAVLPNITGGLCAAAQHPTDADYALLVYSDISTSAAPGSHDLKAAFSADAGATWKPLPTISPSLDLTVTGRPALCFFGNTAILIYSTAATLFSLTSPDRGQTWTSANPVSAAVPDGQDVHYFCLSLAAHEGHVYLLAFAGDTQQVLPGTHIPQQSSPRLLVSSNGGQNWTLRGMLPGIKAPSGIGVSPASGLLRLDTQYVSHDGGLSWVSP